MIVVDTGVLLAAADRDDRWHHPSVALLDGIAAHELVLPAPVIPECGWMIEATLGPDVEAAFLRSVATGEFAVEDLSTEDWARAADLVVEYADLRLGTVDASVIAVAERLKISRVATVNPRDFRVVRPRHCTAFELLPLDT